MAKTPRFRHFQSWLLERMVEADFTPTSLAMALEMLDGDVESWVAGRSIPTIDQCGRLAQIFELPIDRVLAATGIDPSAPRH